MTLPAPKICRRIRQLFRLIGSSNPNEAARAREKLVDLLAKHGLSWNDISACVAAADDDDRERSTTPNPGTPQGPTAGPEVNVLDLVLRLIELHVAITPEERMAVALWTLHTFIFDNFAVTPRLALMSPVRGCGKTTLMVLLELLVANADRYDNVTAAAIYNMLAQGACTVLCDEGDNLGLLGNHVLRAVFNSGHHRGGKIGRFVGGRSRKYPTFAPLAIAAIGMLPLPLLHRSIVINMQRTGGPALKLFDEFDPSFPAARDQIKRWATTCSLVREPELPSSLRNRAADKSVFHFDVLGSVAKSRHAGISWLRFIRQQLGPHVHFWPFDGWKIPAGCSAIAEVYPSLWSRSFAREGRDGDQYDAYCRLSRADQNVRLASFPLSVCLRWTPPCPE